MLIDVNASHSPNVHSRMDVIDDGMETDFND